MIRYRVWHETVYSYHRPVVSSHNEARIRPRQLHRQAVGTSRLDIHPEPDMEIWRSDYFGNEVVFFSVESPHDRLRIVSTSEVDVAYAALPDPVGTAPWEEVVLSVRRAREEPDLRALEFTFDSTSVRRDRELEGFARNSFGPGTPILAGALDLNARIHREFAYDPTATLVSTPAQEVLEQRAGVCQDFAHVMIGALRSIGVPARYVSGYVRPDRGNGSNDERGAFVGAHASHAWVSVYCGRDGWVEMDPTNDMLVSDQHVLLGWGRDYDDVCPVKGVTLGGSQHAVSVEVDVTPVKAN